jgi:uncharacterized protein (DUF305 family)
MLNTKLIAVGLIGVAVGAGGMALAGHERGEWNEQGTHRMHDGEMMDDRSMGTMHGAMGDMMSGLEGKTGDAFDQAFIEEMIVHHQGAVDMANAAQTSAKHPEIKAMADAIIKAQTAEIAQMKEWQKSWYGTP